MALSAENIKAQFDVSDGYVASYPFTFKFWNTSEIKAVLTDGETNTTLVKDVDYSVSAPGSGGTITKLTTWPAALRLTVYREMPLSQDTDLVNGAIQDAEHYEAALDRIVGEIQQLNENIARNIQTPMSDPAAQVITLPPAEQREGKLLGFEKSTGRPIAVSGTLGVTVVTPWAETLLDDENAQQARGTMGLPEISVWAETLLDDENAQQARGTMGVPEISVNAEADKLVHRDASGRAQIADPSVDADIANKGWTRDFVYPVGSYYTQYPDESSNDDATEFPTTQRPATLFGGTWAEQWSTESVFFRTRGTLSDNQRTNGLQDDAVRNVTGDVHRSRASNVSYDYFTRSGTGAFYEDGSRTVSAGSPSGYEISGAYPKFDLSRGIDGGIAGTPDTVHAITGSGAEARGRNRRIKVWKRTA